MKLTLKAARINSGLSTNEILKKIKKSHTWLSLVENGHRGIQADILFRLLNIYGCKADDIILPKLTRHDNGKKRPIFSSFNNK